MSDIGANQLYQAILQAKAEAREELIETISRGLDRAERELFEETFHNDLKFRRSSPEEAAKLAKSRAGRRLGLIRLAIQETMEAEKRRDRELRYSGLDRDRDLRLVTRHFFGFDQEAEEDDGC